MFFNSPVSPLKLIKIRTSLELICPKSPWEQELASTKNDGVPTEDKVDAIFFAIIPDFPTPEIITLPFLQFNIAWTALLNEFLIFFFNFFNDWISVSITSFAILVKFVLSFLLHWKFPL